MITLEKIDQVRERTGLSYEAANKLLEENDGDVVKALIEAEKLTGDLGAEAGFSSKGDQVLKRLKDLVREGNVTKILVKKEDEIIMNIPVSAGAVGVILSPWLGAVGLTAALVAKCEIEVVKEDGEVIKLNEITDKTVDKVKNVFKK